MTHRVIKMTDKAWENGTDWVTAVKNGEFVTVKEFNTVDDANEFLANEVGKDYDKYMVD